MEPKIVSHTQIVRQLETYLLSKQYTLYHYLEETPEFIENNKETRELFLFNWDDVVGDQRVWLENYFVDKFQVHWVRNSIITKNDELIKIKDKASSNHILLKKEGNKITFEINGKKITLHTKIDEEKLIVYEKIERSIIDPNLPVDLISSKIDKGVTYYIVYLIVSTDFSKDYSKVELEKRVKYYRYYLSRIKTLKDLKIILVMPKSIDLNSKFFKETGIGQWIYLGDGTIQEKIETFSITEQMQHEYRDDIAKIKKGETPDFFSKFVYDSVNAIAGLNPDQFGKSSIDRKLLDQIFDLNTISYRDELFEYINEHLTEKGDEYVFTSEIFSSLWKKELGPSYSDFLEVFEPSLQYISASNLKRGGRIYRDHYIHQFQVFLLGLPIIDKKYNLFKERYKQPELVWLVAASFHDNAYPVQLYDKWSGEFFKRVFNIQKEIGTIELKSKFIDEDFLSCLGYLICSFCKTHPPQRTLENNWLASESELIQFIHRMITEEKNHGVLSCVSLLKMLTSIPKETDDSTGNNQIKKEPSNREKVTEIHHDFESALNEIFVPGALAIALHDEKVWDAEIKGKQPDEKEKFLTKLCFDDDPISFLLIFCDCVQEWGRPSKSQDLDENQKEKKFYLKTIDINEEFVKITLWAPYHSKTEDFFLKKQEELKKIQRFLCQGDSYKFIIRIEDKKLKGEEYEMEGPPTT
ncbi:MAG: hypothetical protein LUQ66_03815 [Methanoregula sp.]|nr:hypothetical protein [Methanoregula sp.]